jgi:hypothetical protein
MNEAVETKVQTVNKKLIDLSMFCCFLIMNGIDTSIMNPKPWITIAFSRPKIISVKSGRKKMTANIRHNLKRRIPLACSNASSVSLRISPRK